MLSYTYQPSAGTLLPFVHSISDVTPPHVKHLYATRNIASFKSDIEFLCRNWHPLDFSELKELPLHHERRTCAHSFFLSVDDGMREAYDVIAPILREKGVPAIFFINSATINNRELMWRHKLSLIIDRCKQEPQCISSLPTLRSKRSWEAELKGMQFSDRCMIDEIARLLNIDFNTYLQSVQPYLTTEQLLKLSHDGFAIGAHTHDHPFLPKLTLEDQKEQILMSVEFIRALSLPCRYFSFPFHDRGASSAIFNYLKSLDVELSFGASGEYLDPIPFSFQRFWIEGSHARSSISYILKTLGTKSLMRRCTGTEIIPRH